MSLDRYTQSTLNVARHAKKSEVEGEIESHAAKRRLRAWRRSRLLPLQQPPAPNADSNFRAWAAWLSISPSTRFFWHGGPRFKVD